MTTRTISVRDEAYERLRRARRTRSESFSDVIMRAVWPDAPLSAAAFLDLVRARGPIYQAAELEQIEGASNR
jgi:hypothetical protein